MTLHSAAEPLGRLRLNRFLRVLALAVPLLWGAGAGAVEDKGWPLDVTLGKADAPNVIIEYFSLTCPHCARFEAEVFPKVKSDLLDTGKAKMILRDFPLDDVALAAAMVAHCSGDKYPAFVDAFFKTQASWGMAKDPLAAIKTIALLGGMGGSSVDACLANNDMIQQINARKNDATKTYKVDATPTFVVDGQVVAGEQSFDQIVALLKPGN